ncbi:MAG TPA: hypothetical protein VGP25_04655 [Gemmatimonadaceae bacterium]|nr:hypothetical protein [Gemmatimonadaceae bacterium]
MTSARLTARRSLRVPRIASCAARVARLLLVLSLLASRALPAQSRADRRTPERRTPESSIGRCVDPKAIEMPARLGDGTTLYVEQETVVPQSDGRVLVAGEPVFQWRQTSAGAELVAQDSLIGMVITPPSTVRAVISPLPGRSLASMRSVALPDGWWLVTFAEVVPVQLPKHPKVLAVWAGETDGMNWRAVERLPSVPDSLYISTYSPSALASRDGRVLLALQSVRDDQPRVVLYSRGAEGWSAKSIFVGRRAYVAATVTESHELLAVVRNDSTEREDVNSLFLYARPRGDTTWTEKVRLVRGFRSPVYDPLFDAHDAGVLLTWRVTSQDARETTAWSAELSPLGDTIGPIRQFASDARLVYHAPRGNRGVWVTTNDERPLDRFQLIEHDARSIPTAVSESSTPYGGVLGAALTMDFLVVVASRRGASPDEPAVISLIRSFPWRCH